MAASGAGALETQDVATIALFGRPVQRTQLAAGAAAVVLLLLLAAVVLPGGRSSAPLPPGVSPLVGCDPQLGPAEGVQDVECDAGMDNGATIKYSVSVPAGCAGGGCGLIADIHGWSMSATLEDESSGMRAKGNAAGYVVIQPTAPDSFQSWLPDHHHAKIIQFLRHSVEVLQTDRTRVHVMGYSQGGFASWNILCLASDLICSAAPLEASGLDPWGEGYGSNCFAGPASPEASPTARPPPSRAAGGTSPIGGGPDTPRSILYTSGYSDTLALYGYAVTQVENVKQAYSLSDPVREKGEGFIREMWAHPQLNFTFYQHDYNISTVGHHFDNAEVPHHLGFEELLLLVRFPSDDSLPQSATA